MKKYFNRASAVALITASLQASMVMASDIDRSIFFLDDNQKYVGGQSLNAQANEMESQLRTAKDVLQNVSAKRDSCFSDLDKKLAEIHANRELIGISQDSNCLLNRLTEKEVGNLGNLSAAVYDAYYNNIPGVQLPSKKDLAALKLESDYRERTKLISAIENLDNFSTEILKGDKKATKNILTVINGLNMHDITLDAGVVKNNKGKVTEITSVAHVKKSIFAVLEGVEKDIREKELISGGQNPAHAENVKRALLRSAIYGDKYEAKHVLYRNGGEFSGIVLYNKEDKELVFAMAGSKSLWDWYRNFNGWNGRLSGVTGTLSGMHVHAGFAEHFNGIQDSWGVFIRNFMKEFKQENPNESLNLVGTGHSLGGALAEIFTLSSAEVAESEGVTLGKRGTVTFGAPNVFNPADMQEVIERMGGKGNFIRVQDRYDPVPHACFWRDSPGVVIQGSAGLFTDEAGVLALPVRFNPHSSADYAAFATKIFGKYKQKLSAIRADAVQLEGYQSDINTAHSTIKRVALESNKSMMKALVTREQQDHRQGVIQQLSDKSESGDELSDDEYERWDTLEEQDHEHRVSHDRAKINYYTNQIAILEKKSSELIEKAKSGKYKASRVKAIQKQVAGLNADIKAVADKKSELEKALDEYLNNKKGVANAFTA